MYKTINLIESIASGKTLKIEQAFQEVFVSKIQLAIEELKEQVSSKMFLKEYLTPEQESEYSKHKMTDKARADTDHYFGKGVDSKHEVLHDTNDKSEVHKKVEAHLGKEIDSDHYKQGLHSDKYGRKVRIGKSIKDEKLKQEFDRDSTRAAKGHSGLSVSVHRGTQVAGQTNSVPNEQHPNGHSWNHQSCKNLGHGSDNGSNTHYLKHEIKHGTVLAFLHDKDGKEISRATFQPHHNDAGHTMYAQDSHYGVKHAGFDAHCRKIEKELSGEHKGDSPLYHKNDKVYDNNGTKSIMHPNLSKEHLDKLVKDKSEHVRYHVAAHPNLSKEHLDHLVKDKDPVVRYHTAKHPNLSKEHLDHLVKDNDEMVRGQAAQHPNLSKEHLDHLVKDKDPVVREVVARHPNLTKEHLDHLVKDKELSVRQHAVQHPNLQK